MDGPRSEATGTRFDELHAEAAEALAYAANTLRAARDRYRAAYLDDLARWQLLADDLGLLERGDETGGAIPATSNPERGGAGMTGATRDGAAGDGSDPTMTLDTLAATAAEAGAADLRLRMVRGEVDGLRGDLAQHEAELSRLELAIRNVESTWLFMERGDATLVTEPSLPSIPTELQMRIVEAQEAERARLAQEIHDGPAQALSNAIFQVEFIERVFESDSRMARQELRFLRELLRRELGDVRSFIGQLRPPVLVELGLDGSIVDTVSTQAALSGLKIAVDLTAPSGSLPEAAQTVVLRIVQEALQNVRKHATATNVVVTTALDSGEWVVEVRDDGRGFDTGAVAARGRRNFGLQFMRERAELIGARFEVRSRPEAGTVVRLAIPVARKESG
ncbi:MAG TPA: sensor histidine kinase [Candidatus Limnocylindrales bacterium]|jgi:two-component system sensor histidine kinase DegS